jgi:hypothetical protein
MTEIAYYSLNDINTISFDSTYKLPESVLDIISELSKILGNTNERTTVTHSTYINDKSKRPTTHSDNRSRNKKQSSVFTNEGKSEEAWEHLRSFKATVVEKKTEGIDKTINDIRVCLNKISQKNYEIILPLIIELIQTISENPENLKIIANYVFEIASTNKFFSEVYASLYKELTTLYDIFQIILSDFVSTFKTKFQDIQYIDPNGDYDAFCANNKINDSRKATAVFIVNLVKKDVIPKDVVLNIIDSAIDTVLEYIDTPNKINQVEEITENIFLLISESYLFLRDSTNWGSVLENVKMISQMKVKEKASLSSRAVFKFMDILDKTKK